jgi:hypothetical protein
MALISVLRDKILIMLTLPTTKPKNTCTVFEEALKILTGNHFVYFSVNMDIIVAVKLFL